ncbi:MAG: hypothetical protein LBH17_06255 [Oscillospiraceae bacterium]|nr:hypothetical protein [Oscillospiraceae bacterium]
MTPIEGAWRMRVPKMIMFDYGASAVGIHPVWYQCGEIIDNFDPNDGASPTASHTLIRDWREMIDVIERI